MRPSQEFDDNDLIDDVTPCAHSKQSLGGRSRDRRTKSPSVVGHPHHRGEYDSLFGIASENVFEKANVESLIDPEVHREFGNETHLIHSINKTLERILRHFPEATVNVVVERDRENPELSLPLVRVEKAIEDVDEWKYVKDAVQMIARESERGDTTIYTDVDRK